MRIRNQDIGLGNDEHIYHNLGATHVAISTGKIMWKFYCKSSFGNFTMWEKREISRIEALSDRQVIHELGLLMKGEGYSWIAIYQRLQTRLDAGLLFLDHFEPGNIIYEWNVLCDEKMCWMSTNQPSFTSLKFDRDCLKKLKIIPTQAGLGAEGKRFATSNIDTTCTQANLAIDYFDLSRRDQSRILGDVRDGGFFYHEGPEYRVEYIHDRVEY